MRRNKGFTLIELLIVVAIIAILAAVSIPIFTSQLEKTREATCMANKRSLKAELTMEYLTDSLGSSVNESTGAVTLTAEQAKAYVCPSGGVISAAIKNGSVGVVCSKHDNVYAFGDKDTMEALKKVLAGATTTNIDSGAAAVSDSTHAAKLKAALKEAGLDLDAMGAKTWYYQKNNQALYWTNVDISTMNKGDTLPVIMYNGKTGTYTVLITKVGVSSTSQTHGVTYNTIGTIPTNGANRSDLNKGYAPSTGDKTKQTYADALAFLKEAQEKLAAGEL